MRVTVMSFEKCSQLQMTILGNIKITAITIFKWAYTTKILFKVYFKKCTWQAMLSLY